MQIEKVCQTCGKRFCVPHWRENAKFCSIECQRKSLRGKNNATCTYCGKEFHVKQSQIDRYNRSCGIFCSRECMNEYRKIWFKGSNNHQYGLKGKLNSSFKGQETEHQNHKITDIYVYCPNHPYADKNGRVVRHRLVVEQNSKMFDNEYFEVVNGITVLKKDFVVHHKDGNHNNDDVSNLEVMTLSEHTKLHNNMIPRQRDSKTGRFVSGK